MYLVVMNSIADVVLACWEGDASRGPSVEVGLNRSIVVLTARELAVDMKRKPESKVKWSNSIVDMIAEQIRYMRRKESSIETKGRCPGVVNVERIFIHALGTVTEK
jgi:hypothetical protein